METPTPCLISGQDLAAWRSQARQQAIAADVPVDEVDWLLQEVAGLDRLSLRLESFARRSQISLSTSLSDLSQGWERRLRERLPVQYVLGVTPWRHFSLQVSPAVLIPRPETELLIDLAKQAVQDSPIADLGSGHWVDLGTGSGAITLGLADALPRAIIHGVDRSPAALAIAQQNADKLGLTARLHFYQGSWWSPLASLAGQVSGMVSNPPYIPTVSLAGLQPEVIEHEPLLALDGGHDGLEHIRHLVSTAPTYLRAGGIWLIEMMAGQAEDVVQLLEQQGSYQRIQVFSDLAGIDRFVLGIRC